MGNPAQRYHSKENSAFLAIPATTDVPVLPSNRSIRQVPIARESLSDVSATGTVDETGTLDVTITSVANGASPLVTTPTFNGLGSGALIDISADPGTDSRTVEVELTDPGTVDVLASINILGVRLEARNPGTNPVIEVDDSEIQASLVDTGVRLAADVQAGSERIVALLAGLDGIFFLDEQGRYAEGSKRFTIGNGRTVYRIHLEFVDSQQVFVLDRKTPVDLPAGAIVYEVQDDVAPNSGPAQYTINVRPDVGAPVAESYDVVTPFDFISQLRQNGGLSGSDILRVDGVLAEDFTPGGAAAEDWPLLSSPYIIGGAFIPLAGERQSIDPVERLSASPQSAASAAAIMLRCTDNAVPGSEVWEVTNSATGAVDTAITEQRKLTSALEFTIPLVEPVTESDVTGRVYVSSKVLNDETADIFLAAPQVGRLATNRTFDLTYVQKVDLCDLSGLTFNGGPRLECLGIDALASTIGDSTAMMDDADYKSAIQSYAADLKSFAEGDVNNFEAAASNLEGQLPQDNDIEAYLRLLEKIVDATRIIVNETTLGTTERNDGMNCVNSAAGVLSSYMEAYRDSNPAPATALSDGTGVNVSPADVGRLYRPPPATGKSTDLFRLTSVTLNPPAANTLLPSAQLDVGGNWDNASAGNTSVFTSVDPGPGPHQATFTFVANASTISANIGVPAEQFFSELDTFMDGLLYDCVAQACVDPFVGASSVSGPSCWQDLRGQLGACWEFDDGFLLPMFQGEYYHSAFLDGDGRVKPAYLFGGALVACGSLTPGDTISITISGTAQSLPRYNVGDKYVVNIVGGFDLQLRGAVVGNNQQVWSVRERVGAAISAALPVYTLDLLNPQPYSASGGAGQPFDFEIAPGAVPFTNGARFVFAIDNKQFTWQFDGGTLNGPFALAPTTILGDVQLGFQSLTISPYVAGDIYRFELTARNAVSNAKECDKSAYRWQGATGRVILDGATTLDTMFIWHDLPAGATLELEADSTVLQTWAITDSTPRVLAFAQQDELMVATGITLTATGATDGCIFWIDASVAIAPKFHASRISLLDRANRGGNSRYARPAYGCATDVQINYINALLREDWEALRRMVAYSKEQGNSAVGFLPNFQRPEDAFIGRPTAGSVTSEWSVFQPYDAERLYYSYAMTFLGVWR